MSNPLLVQPSRYDVPANRPRNDRPIRSRFKPQPRARLRLEPRDTRLLADLFLHRAMSRGQLQALYFGSVQRCNLRLRQLFDHDYVTRHYLPAAPFGAQAIYAVSRAALPVIAQHLKLDLAEVRAQYRQARTPTFIEHTLEIVNVRLALLAASAVMPTVEIERWLPEASCRHEYEIRHGSNRQCATEIFKPDAFVRLRQRERGDYLNYFFEVDLGHTSSAQFLRKLAIHQRYLESGLFSEVYGCDYFKTLVITTTSGRLRNLRALVESQGSDLFWFTTFEQVNKSGILSNIWQVPQQPHCRDLLANHELDSARDEEGR